MQKLLISAAVVLVLAAAVLWLGLALSTAPVLPAPLSNQIPSTHPSAAAADSLPLNLPSTSEPAPTAIRAAPVHSLLQEYTQLRQQSAVAVNADLHALVPRLAALESQLAGDLPPVSLHVKNASLPEVVDALNAAMGTSIQFTRLSAQAVPRPGTYTLDLTDTPFWEIIAALDAQRPFRIDTTSADLALRVADVEPGMGQHQISGPFFFYAFTQNLSITTPPTYWLAYGIFVDPRLSVASFSITQATRTDAARGRAAGTAASQPAASLLRNPPTTFAMAAGHAERLQNSYTAISKIDALNVAVTFRVGVPIQTLDVPDIDSAPAWEATFGNAKATLVNHEIAGSTFTAQFHVTPESATPDFAFQLFGARGSVRWAGAADESGTVSARILSPDPPWKLRVTRFKILRTFSTAFEIRDIPLPRH